MKPHRYELKFILNESDYARSQSWLYTKTGAKRRYKDRIVNSVYFDDPGYSSVRDNLAGISMRKKTRLRWYQSDEYKIDSLALEIKYRNGRLGSKDKYPLFGLEAILLETRYRDFFNVIQDALLQDSLIFEGFVSPTLHISYKRSYFEGEGGVRVTFDRPVKFYQTLPNLKPFQTSAIAYPYTIMEIKFPMSLKNNVTASLRSLNMTPKRHSKYLVGLAAFGYAKYF